MWIGIKDSDPRAVALFRRHYSCRDPKIDYGMYGFSGKGESMILLTVDCNALWCWRRVEGQGIYCSVFRNEGDILSSDLVKEADLLAWERWSDERHYTHVNPKEVHGDGKCFKAAGWAKLKERTKKNKLIILEIIRSLDGHRISAYSPGSNVISEEMAMWLKRDTTLELEPLVCSKTT